MLELQADRRKQHTKLAFLLQYMESTAEAENFGQQKEASNTIN
jgi:hypothetical protein